MLLQNVVILFTNPTRLLFMLHKITNTVHYNKKLQTHSNYMNALRCICTSFLLIYYRTVSLHCLVTFLEILSPSVETHNLQSLHTILSTGSPLKPQSYDYVYRCIKSNVLLGSISGDWRIRNSRLKSYKNLVRRSLDLRQRVSQRSPNSTIIYADFKSIYPICFFLKPCCKS